ncbi:FKBP-type peptidyl-prolyl cis-trans isomerase [Nocardiopsis coralliicola]
MPRRAAAIAVPLSIALLALSGCSSIPEKYRVPAFMRTGAEVDERLPTVTGDPGEEPKVDLPDIEPPGEQVEGVLREGESEAIVRKDDLVMLDVVEYSWTGKGEAEKANSSYESGSPLLINVEQLGEFGTTLVDQNVGAQIAFITPPPDPAQAQMQGMPPQEGDTVSVMEIRDRFGNGDTVEGEQTTDGGDGLPTAPDNGAAAPEISIPEETEPPKDLEKANLIEGDGPAVENGQQVVAQYTGVRWDDGKVFDTSFGEDGQPFYFPLGQGQVIEGWDQGLEGEKVGSRVMLVVPEDLAYGKEAEEGGQPAGTLVFVIDILAAVDPPPEPEAPEGGAEGGEEAPPEEEPQEEQ